MRLSVLSLFLFAACKAPTPTVEPNPTLPVLDCTTVALDSCDTTDGCAPILGSLVGPVAASSLCLDPAVTPEVVGCQAEGNACPAVEIYAAGPAEDVYWIPAGCAPDGWDTLNLELQECGPDCANTSLDDCATTSGCMLIEGQQLVDAAPECFDAFAPVEALACTVEMDCDQAVSYATEGLDTPVYRIADGCQPPGWTDVSGPFEDCPCSAIGVDTCGENPACQLISARPLGTDATGDCVDPNAVLEPIACGPSDVPCGDLLVYATDPAGAATWEFPDTCIPDEWTVSNDTFEVCQP